MVLPRGGTVRQHVVVAREFRPPGHPVVFWLGIVVLVFGLYSLGRAATTYDRCDSVSRGHKHWQVLPPDWVCD